MDCCITDWLPDSFFRSPVWRIHRAEYRRERDLPADPRIDDAWVEIALKLLTSAGICDRTVVAPEVRLADLVWQGGDTLRWFLESQLLTSRTFAEVAGICSLPEHTVEAYHHLFFDVRSRPQTTDWVMARAVGSYPLNGFAGPQPAGLWKYAGFTGGPHVLDAIVAVTLPRPVPAWLVHTFGSRTGPAEQRLRLKAKLAIAVLTANATEHLGSILELSDRLRALEVEAGLVDDDPQLRIASTFLASLGRMGTPRRAPVMRKPEPDTPTVHRERMPEIVPAESLSGGDRDE